MVAIADGDSFYFLLDRISTIRALEKRLKRTTTKTIIKQDENKTRYRQLMERHRNLKELHVQNLEMGKNAQRLYDQSTQILDSGVIPGDRGISEVGSSQQNIPESESTEELWQIKPLPEPFLTKTNELRLITLLT